MSEEPLSENGSAAPAGYDFDWLVVGSGFGGSVSALRLTEKGYSVGVLECGRRFSEEDFAESTWQLKRYFWAPKIGLKGIFRMTVFKDLFVVSGCGVGGGSLGYANTLYVPPEGSPFYSDPQWAGLAEWEETLAPHYAEAERMLGVTPYEGDGPVERLLREIGEELGVGETHTNTRVGVFFGTPGETVPDPYFGGEGPDRAGCIRCGACMVGCRHNAKNTLTKNYLWFAERNGAEVMPERTVTDVRPIGAADGSDGYEVVSERSGAWLRKDRQVHRAKHVVLSAGPLGTNLLLQRCRRSGSLPRLSARIGHLVRSNSEAITAVTARDERNDFSKGLAITSSIYPDEHTHIETVTYGEAGDSMSTLFTILAGKGNRVTRPLKAIAAILRRPFAFMRSRRPRGWSRRTIILLTMQSLDNAMRLVPKRRLFDGGVRLQTKEDPERPNPRFIPVADKATRLAADKLDGIPQGGFTETFFNIPTTAHIMGGAVIAESPESGVVDFRQRAFGYENLMICDGSVIPANIGVNPSLTITAMTEHAMSHVPAATPSDQASTAAAPPEQPSGVSA